MTLKFTFKLREKERTCPICKGYIKTSDDGSSCPNCQTLFHTSHFAEWIKLKGQCPICKKDIIVSITPQKEDIHISVNRNELVKNQKDFANPSELSDHEKSILKDIESYTQHPLKEVDNDELKRDDHFLGTCFSVYNGHIDGLIIKNREIENFPKSLFDLTYLRHLVIYLPNVQMFPDLFDQFDCLQSISTSVSLPESSFNIPSLETLVFIDNEYQKTLSEEFNHLENLTELRFINDGLISLPNSIGDLSKLELLQIHGLNQIKTLPESIGNLSRLRSIFIMNNQNLLSLPDTLPQLSNLLHLEIRENKSLFPKTEFLKSPYRSWLQQLDENECLISLYDGKGKSFRFLYGMFPNRWME